MRMHVSEDEYVSIPLAEYESLAAAARERDQMRRLVIPSYSRAPLSKDELERRRAAKARNNALSAIIFIIAAILVLSFGYLLGTLLEVLI